MTTALAVIPEQVAPLPALPAADLDRAAAFARQDKAPATRRAYQSDFASFQTFCLSRGVASLPATAEPVAAYLWSEAEAGSKASTISPRRGSSPLGPKPSRPAPSTNCQSAQPTTPG